MLVKGATASTQNCIIEAKSIDDWITLKLCSFFEDYLLNLRNTKSLSMIKELRITVVEGKHDK